MRGSEVMGLHFGCWSDFTKLLMQRPTTAFATASAEKKLFPLRA